MTTIAHWKHRALAAEADLAAARQELDRLRARPATGRPSTKPRTADAKLVADVCAKLGLTRGELAARLECDQALLAPSRKLTEERREKLRALLA